MTWCTTSRIACVDDVSCWFLIAYLSVRGLAGVRVDCRIDLLLNYAQHSRLKFVNFTKFEFSIAIMMENDFDFFFEKCISISHEWVSRVDRITWKLKWNEKGMEHAEIRETCKSNSDWWTSAHIFWLWQIDLLLVCAAWALIIRAHLYTHNICCLADPLLEIHLTASVCIRCVMQRFPF